MSAFVRATKPRTGVLRPELLQLAAAHELFKEGSDLRFASESTTPQQRLGEGRNRLTPSTLRPDWSA